MAKISPQVQDHLQWLGFVQPTGLVVSPYALVERGVVLLRNDREGQGKLLALLPEGASEDPNSESFRLPDFETFARAFLGWSWKAGRFAGGSAGEVPEALRYRLEDYEETLAPNFAVADLKAGDEDLGWQMLVCEAEAGVGLDEPTKAGGSWEASPHARLERLLRGVGVPAGILYNGQTLRLVSAPHGETSGWIDFKLEDMVQTAGRPVCAALRLLLKSNRIHHPKAESTLAALLVASRQYQNAVSEKLAEQVLHALYELLRGLEKADADSGGALLQEIRRDRPDEVYHGLLNVLLRMVFLLYAEERGMLPTDEAFLRHYSLVGLHRRLTEDAALHPDTMDQRFGAWAQLIVLFRMVHDGAESGALQIPARHGVLFDPDQYPFLEGRTGAGSRQVGERLDYPRIPDGAIQRVLEKLLVLDGERLSYRALDVEQIGSVYETMMGFRIETATGTSIAIKAQKKGGAPTTIDLDALQAMPGKARGKWIKEKAQLDVQGKTLAGNLKDASTLEELHSALDKHLDKAATPDLVPKGSLVLQPSEARRKSGSHYTPRELTEPIVRTTLRPILERLREEAGGPPTPDQILDLKVCDPAMGSGAFLVEACRQLGDALIEAWGAHDARPKIPGDEDEVIHARRLVAQRCLYGVDRNPVAVNLAKVSLWLTTLAKDHAFTFVDHALRHGDSLVGLTNAQVAARDWSNEEPLDSPKYRQLKAKVDGVGALRRQIREAGDGTSDWELRDLLDAAEFKASEVRTWGDLVIEAFFSADKDKARKQALGEVAKQIAAGVDSGERARLDELRHEDPPLAPFHWELEFPEVFDRERPGMDAFVGNPPFLGGGKISGVGGKPYLEWILQAHPGSHGNGDLVAHFFRRTFTLLKADGCLGLIATNTIAQGDTRTTGLEWICEHGGAIYDARRRVKWPGIAAVVVSVVHVFKGPWAGVPCLDGRGVPIVTAFLFHRGGHQSPAKLRACRGMSFKGSTISGNGFTFDDTDKKGVASSLSEMEWLIASNPKNGELIFPYIGGAEVNTSPTHAHHRYVINFGEREEAECRRVWPDLMAIVEEKVKPDRLRGRASANDRLSQQWWKFERTRREMYAAIAGLERVLVNSEVSAHVQFAFSPANRVFAHTTYVYPLTTHAAFAALQSRPHELWARFFGSSLEDRLRYTPSDCFETFPFPGDWQTHPALETAGQAYYDFRAELMVETDLGLTKTYNRFHDPDKKDPKIVRLRELHAAMDRAVLGAYGWTDISTDCEFLPEHEGDESSKMRYRWPNEVRDEVLARLLELNAQRAAEEAGTAGPGQASDAGGLFTQG